MKKQRFILPRNVKYIISMLNEAGYRADIVGGSVRDMLLGKEPCDYDITTSAAPSEMQEVFSDHKLLDVGIKHGTLTVILDGEPYEVTTYRVDGEYKDNRHPDSVTFTRDIKADLSRRDFTVNAMCYNETDGFTDLFGGITDLKAGLVRAVGVPEERFGEDALRIFRALRFASVLDFKIEELTAAALRKCAPLLKNVSAERIYTEWKKLISGKGAYRIIGEFSDVISVVMPNIKLHPALNAEVFNAASSVLRELTLFESAAEYEIAMHALKSDNKRRLFGCSVLEAAEMNLENREGVARSLIAYGNPETRTAIELKILRGELTEAALMDYDKLLAGGICYKLSELDIGGSELICMGLSGKRVGETLERLLLLCAEGKINNKRDELLSAVTEE